MTAYLLIFIGIVNGGDRASISITQEFSNREFCELAKSEIREKITNASISLITCVRK